MAITRTRRHFDFGDSHGDRFRDILPAYSCAIAATTCYFEVRGLNSNGNEWGIGICTNMQTHGEMPTLPDAIQRRGNCVQFTSHDSAARILECFDMTVEQLFSCCGGIPQEGERITIDLVDVFHACNHVAAADAA